MYLIFAHNLVCYGIKRQIYNKRALHLQHRFYIIWCPKYQRKVLVDGIDERLKELLIKKVAELDIQIEKMEVMSNHVHLFVKEKTVDSCSAHCESANSLQLRNASPGVSEIEEQTFDVMDTFVLCGEYRVYFRVNNYPIH